MPAPQSQKPLETPRFPNRSFFYAEQSWAYFGARAAKKRRQTFHTGSNRKKERMHIFEGSSGGTIAQKNHSEASLEKDVIDTTERASSLHLPAGAMNALARLRKTMYPVSSLNNIDLRMVFKKYGFQHSMTLAASVKLVLTNPPYNLGCVSDEEDSNHAIFAFADMTVMLKFHSDMRQLGAHANNFCSAL